MPLSPDFYPNANVYSTTNNLNGAGNRARVGGSSFTVFTWQGHAITFARQISHQSPAPVAAVSPIHPLDAPYPIEIITPQALTMGTITLELYELYGATVWQRLAGIANPNSTNGGSIVDLANVFASVANSPSPISVFRIIRPPSIRGRTLPSYTEEFHNVIISSIDDGETIEIGTMEVIKTIVCNYTHITRGGKNGLLSPDGVGRAPVGTSFS